MGWGPQGPWLRHPRNLLGLWEAGVGLRRCGGPDQWAPLGWEMGIDCSRGTKRSVLPLHIYPRHGQGAFELLNSAWSLFHPFFAVSPTPRFALKRRFRTGSKRAAGNRCGAALGRRAPGCRGLALRRLGGSSCGATGGSVAGAGPAGSAVFGACRGCRGKGTPHGCGSRDAWGGGRPESSGPRTRLAVGKRAGQSSRAFLSGRAREAAWLQNNGLGPTPQGGRKPKILTGLSAGGRGKFLFLIWAHREPKA